MGLVHTPRTLFAIGKGLARRRNAGSSSALGGIGEENPFITYCRAGLFDCDYQMHMNNAAYLSHAEYARWELCAYNGLMQSMFQEKVNFLVGSTVVRYRREIRPVFRSFEIHSSVVRLDDRNLWVYHAFRYPEGGKDPGRIRAQVVCRGIAVQNRTVLDPRLYLKEKVGMDPAVIDSISQEEDDNTNNIMADLMDKYVSMEDVLKEAASKDDEEKGKNT